MKIIGSALKTGLNLFFPETCRICQKILCNEEALCSECFKKTKWIHEPMCTICGKPFEGESVHSHPCPDCLNDPPPFNRHRSCFRYEGDIPRLITRFKYGASLDLSKLLTGWMIEKLKPLLITADYLIPVPLTLTRLKKRTFNQSLEIARLMAHELGLPLLVHSLAKVRNTAPQTTLPRKERIHNLKGAFVWTDRKTNLDDKTVVLVDDVYSTGSTLKACAMVLTPLKPRFVHAVTLAMNVI